MGKSAFHTTMEYFDRLCNCHCTCCDIETRGKGSKVINSIAFTLNDPLTAFVVPLDGRYFDKEQERELWVRIKYSLRRVKSIWQNGIFDAGLLYNYGVDYIRFGWDTMVAQHLLYTEFPRGLDALVSFYLERGYHKGMIGDDLELYNGIDVVTTHEVAQEQARIMTQDDLDAMRHLMDLHMPLITMEKRGLRVDLSYKEEALADFKQQQAELTRQLNEEVASRPIKPQSSPDLQKYFYAEKGIKPYISRDTGRPTVDRKALEKIARKGYKEADLILQIRKISKLSGTYFNMQLDDDDRLRCQIKPTGTVTGRLATSQTPDGTGANLQNLPSEYGYCILPDEGMIFINVDLEQAEKRLVALLTGDPDDLRDFRMGEDIHRRRAAEVLGKDPADVTDWERNKIGKPLNHMTSYDCGPNTFAETAGLSNAEGKRVLETYHKQHPKLKEYFASVRDELKRGNTLRNMFGRPRRFFGPRDGPLHRSAYDFRPQSTVGEICNRAIVDFYYNAPEWFLLLMQVHDSILVEVPDKQEAIWQACQLFEKYFHYEFRWNGERLDVPLSYQIGYRWNKKYMVEFTDISFSNVQKMYEQLQGGK